MHAAAAASAHAKEPYAPRLSRASSRLQAFRAVEMASMELSGLFVYPVKSCRGVALQSGVVSATGALCGSRKLPIAMARTVAALGGARRRRCCCRRRRRLLAPCHISLASLPTVACWMPPAGLLFDRQFMVVKESGGRFLTQRQFPKCAPCPPCCMLAPCPPSWVGM